MEKGKVDLTIEKLEFDFGENAENFNAALFLDCEIPDFKQRAKSFSTQIKKLVDNGFIFRKVHGPITKFTMVEDPQTSQIRPLMMLGSNNYLDLAIEPHVKNKTIEAIEKFGTGCGGPALLNGYTSIHKELEQKIAKSKGMEDALIFSSGYSANVGWPSALLTDDDFLVYDIQSHGSLFDGIKLGNFKSVPFLHNDSKSLEGRLKKIRIDHPKSNIIVCVEGVYSMDGDIAPLDEFKLVCEKYNCLLCIDDAHGTGVMGHNGHGTQEHFNLQGKVEICMGTFSKSLTATGGYIASSEDIINYLRIYANSYIYSATVAPSIIATALGALEFIEKNPHRVKALHDNTQYFVKKLNSLGFDVKSESAIIPIFIRKDVSIRDLVSRFHQEGIFINGIEYPSVPRAKQRLRLSMMATFTKAELDEGLKVFEKIGKEFDLI